MAVQMDISASVSAPRRLESSDRPAALEHLLRLSGEARQMRFCQVMSDEAVRAYAAKTISSGPSALAYSIAKKT